jgi:hypothetical protein
MGVTKCGRAVEGGGRGGPAPPYAEVRFAEEWK